MLAAGRRFGKNVLAADVLVDAIIRGQPVAWFAPTYRMLLDAWRVLRETLLPLTKTKNEEERRIDLVTRGSLDMWSLDSADTVRGKKYALGIIDEAAMIPNLETAWSSIIRPTLTDLRGSAWFLSTPRGHNYFHTLYQRGLGGQVDWQSWQHPTADNPFILPAEIEDARRDLPEAVFAQEYMADFTDDAALVFRNVYACATATPQEPAKNTRYVLGVDWGKINDFSVLSVLNSRTAEQVYLERFNKIEYAYQLERVKLVVERYRPVSVVIEANNIGDPLIDRLRRDGVQVKPFVTSHVTKGKLIETLALAFERQALTILNNKTQIGELLSYTSERLPAGSFRYAAAGKGHDDTVIALALAYSACERQLPDSLLGHDRFDPLYNAPAGLELVRSDTGGVRFAPKRIVRQRHKLLTFG